jgi:hypothetical protein
MDNVLAAIEESRIALGADGRGQKYGEGEQYN